MSTSKLHHRKRTGYKFKQWLNSVLIRLKIKKRRFQKPPSDIIFLTTEEVKASLAKTSEYEPVNKSPDSSSRPDPGILPPKNRSRRKRQNDKSISIRLKRILKRISFGIFNKKKSSHLHRQPIRNRIPDQAADAEFQRISELKRLKENRLSNEVSTTQAKVHHQHRKRSFRSRFRKLKSVLMRKLNFSHKKNGFSNSFTFANEENSRANQEKEVPWTDYIKPTLTSTSMFMVAYQVSWFFYQSAVMVTASFFKIDSVLYYYEVMFPEGSDSIKWSPEKIIIITLAGPFLALVAWIILRLILKIKERYGSHFRMFLVWMYLISMMMFFGAFVGGAITLEGFGYVIDWLFMSISLRLILSLIFISMIIALSWNVVGFMPETTRSGSWKNNRYKYVLSRLIVPWLLGAGIMAMLKITKNITQHENIFDYDIINLATLVFAVVPPLFNSGSRPQLIRRRKVNARLKAEQPVLWIAGAIVLVMLFRIVLNYGIYFKLVFNLDLYFYK
jgi:hypothetical protein